MIQDNKIFDDVYIDVGMFEQMRKLGLMGYTLYLEFGKNKDLCKVIIRGFNNTIKVNNRILKFTLILEVLYYL